VDYNRGVYTFQVGAFIEKGNAERFQQKLAQTYQNVHVVPFNDGELTYYRVRVGRAHSLIQALEYQTYLFQNGFPEVITVAE
jgi:rare lipoprotein A